MDKAEKLKAKKVAQQKYKEKKGDDYNVLNKEYYKQRYIKNKLANTLKNNEIKMSITE